jgi:hypothetical protein
MVFNQQSEINNQQFHEGQHYPGPIVPGFTLSAKASAIV